MLITFRVTNFRSFKDQQEFTLVASSLKDSAESVVPIEGLDLGLLKVAAVYGPNASGKTNLLVALYFMRNAVRDSQHSWVPDGPIPYNPFLLDEASKNAPSRFEVDLLLNRTRYNYGFVSDQAEIVEEWLYAYPQGRKQEWFYREAGVEKQKFSFGKNLSGDNRTIEGFTRPNSLFLSAAAQYNHEQLLPVYRWFSTQLHFLNNHNRRRARQSTIEFCRDELRKKDLLKLLYMADLGVVGLEVKEGESAKNTVYQDIDGPFGASSKDLSAPRDAVTDFALKHRGAEGKNQTFSSRDESDGTTAYFTLLGPVLRALDAGGTLCIDELDASLHPLLALELLRLFSDNLRNPKSAQLIFNTHDTNLLDSSVLRRDQIWFTEKDHEGSTHLYPLTDFKPRKHENIERGYLQGRYGAVPFIGTLDPLVESE